MKQSCEYSCNACNQKKCKLTVEWEDGDIFDVENECPFNSFYLPDWKLCVKVKE